MIELDFGFFNLIKGEKTGLVYRQKILDRLAPLLFCPRVKNLIDIPRLNCKGCNIVMPLGRNNLELISSGKQEWILNHSLKIADNFGSRVLAVDRRLKGLVQQPDDSLSVIFGDNMLKALAVVITRDAVSRHDIDKVIIVGEIEELPLLADAISYFGVAVSLQNKNPEKYDALSYRLLYEKGSAVSVSLINPYKWEEANLVIIFDNQVGSMAFGLPGLKICRLTDDRQGLCQSIEYDLARSGLDTGLHNTAPILETCLLSQEGFSSADGEQNKFNDGEGVDFIKLVEIGDRTGMWDLFLDNA